MDVDSFTSSMAGELLGSSEDAKAFIPYPLPPALDSIDVLGAASEAMLALGELRGACRRLGNPYALIRPLQRREALTSSAMEGTFTEEDDLLIAESSEGSFRPSDATIEVRNYGRALRQAVAELSDLPISHRMLRAAHGTLLEGVGRDRGARVRPGEYKRDQNLIGGRTMQTARFVPPPPSHAQGCMDALEAYINRPDKRMPEPVLDLALAHYQFETIHPFADGNGRLGRMLITLMSLADGLLDQPILYMSPALEREKSAYIDLMFNVSARGEWEPWIRFFLGKLAESCRETIGTIDRILALQEKLKAEVGAASRSSTLMNLVDFLFEQPVISVREAEARLGITNQGARNAVNRLVEMRVLVELRQQYPFLYLAPEIVNAAHPRP